MTHMLRLTAGDLDVGWERKKKKEKRKSGPHGRELHDPIASIQNPSCLDACTRFLLIGLICGKMHCHYSYPALTDWRGTGEREREESVVQ